jgi:hypothetical protein
MPKPWPHLVSLPGTQRGRLSVRHRARPWVWVLVRLQEMLLVRQKATAWEVAWPKVWV